MVSRAPMIAGLTGAVLLLGGGAVAAVLPEPRSPGDLDSINVNASCGSDMHLDIGWGWEPAADIPIIVTVTTSEGEVIQLVDDDLSDLRGFHPVIPAEQLPDTSYSYTVDFSYGDIVVTDAFTGEVRCGSEPIPSGTPTTEPTEPPPPPDPDPVPPDPEPITPEVEPVTPETTDPDPDATTDPEVGVEDETVVAPAADAVVSDAGYTG
ncbi:hypothetical protein [Demequina lignilytica]|uniref:Uncharacterized protein n=1 Tax=Demequina lignilytica TaxID=3051663 RepID=A0AB35MK79_9MICO|nr:hypothetical protein [Demequina sp. SYSU T0a273]MDN4484157.1 hypothetical protein [Demequina sp. SYSU T0a273]